MIVVLLQDEYNHKFIQPLEVFHAYSLKWIQCSNTIGSADWKVTDMMDSTERKKQQEVWWNQTT